MSAADLLREYVKLVLENPNARVPTQLLDPDDVESQGEDDEELDEFSAAGGGAVAGYTGALGVNPDKLGRKKNKPKK